MKLLETTKIRFTNLKQKLELCYRIMKHKESNREACARRELVHIGTDEMGLLMAKGIMEIVTVFSTQGHSGFSAPYAVSIIEKLLAFKPITDLTGADSEWNEVGDGLYQNNRNSAVFKDVNKFDGQAYYLDGKIFTSPDGSTYTNGKSRTVLTFPCTPVSLYVNVDNGGNEIE
jgi:hypothetical protein